ncbi:D-tyrosyl-tRNA(Tyr) deacylase [Candidatus Roizmanbacteria bacterium]|jgi:D-tyrosyl-tRNA(Tyr) deacylase|nr:D-tyrosyl-tRNA(Tyr) deacylase [Candidatus Roizmanbacteria bacterium]
MIALIQRVSQGRVLVKKNLLSEIDHGYVILLGIFREDNYEDVVKLADKIVNLRIMSDEQLKMNRSITDTKGKVLLVSQFTLCADVSGGRRPSFIKAKEPKEAETLYRSLKTEIEKKGVDVVTGKFGEYMDVIIHNDGPVTIMVDSKNI